MKQIALTRGLVATVDDDDYIELSKYKWYAHKERNQWYAYRSEAGRMIAMHRVVSDAPIGFICDHINGDGLDNRRANLRVCTIQQNAWNSAPRNGTSKFKGVSFYKPRAKWVSYIYFQGQKEHLGYYDNEIEAGRAYDSRARELFGEFARLNLG